jgi:hypothetical protein
LTASTLPPWSGTLNILRAGTFAVTLALRWYSAAGAKLDEVFVDMGSNYQRYRTLSTGQTQALPSTSGYCQIA